MSGTLLNVFLFLLVFAAGVSVALQQVLNANLRVTLASPWWAGFASYVVGTVVMLIAGLVTGAPPQAQAAVARTPWLSWTGGIFGAFFIATAILMVPRLGAATFLALVVVGQMLAALVFDHYGLFGLPPHAATPARAAGVALLIAGVILVRSQ